MFFMKIAAKICPICFLLLLVNQSFAQKHGLAAIDSMKRDLRAYTKEDSMRVKLIYRVGNPYVEVNPDSALAYAKQGMALAKKLNFKRGIASFYTLLGSLSNDNGKYDDALYNYQQGYKISVSIGNKNGIIVALNNLGSMYERKGNYVKSQEYNFKALKVAEEAKDARLIAVVTNNIGNMFKIQHDYKQALNYQLRALESYEQLDDKDGMASADDKIGSSYHEQGDLKVANIYYQRALKLFRLTDNRLQEATVLGHIGLLNEKDLDVKLGYLIKAQQIFDATNPQYTISIGNLLNIGGTYANVFVNKLLKPNTVYKNIPGSYEVVAQRAQDYLQKAIKYSKAAGDADNLSYASDNLSQLQESLGDYKNAFLNFKVSRTIDDSLYSQESKNKLAELTAKYTFQKKEDIYKQQQQITDLKMRQLYLYAALAILLVSGVLIFFLNRSRISQLRLKNELQKKEAEEQTRELLHRNKLSESELKAIRAQMNPHFIFNVLNSIESYIMDNNQQMACRLVQKFASLSRIILENSTQSMVTAEREWKALQLYTELEAMRFNYQFTYSFYADPLIDLSALLLPPMLIQPLIENSIHHGLRNSPDADKKLSIKLEQTEQELLFTVEDNGVGIDENAKPKTSAIKGKSIGLAAIRERIGIINFMNTDKDKKAAEFKIAPKSPLGKGTVATLKLPKVLKNS